MLFLSPRTVNSSLSRNPFCRHATPGTLLARQAIIFCNNKQIFPESFHFENDEQNIEPGGQAVTIQWFEPSPTKVHQDEDEMLALYPTPQPSKFKMSDAVTESRLTRENYKARLHALLFLEEMSQYKVSCIICIQRLESINVKFDRNLFGCQFCKVFWLA